MFTKYFASPNRVVSLIAGKSTMNGNNFRISHLSFHLYVVLAVFAFSFIIACANKQSLAGKWMEIGKAASCLSSHRYILIAAYRITQIPTSSPMIRIVDKESGKFQGEIAEEQLCYLIDQLEEERKEDNDYYINRYTLDVFKEKGIDSQLLALLRQGLGDRQDMEIVFERTV